jgi:CBS domain-containing protein
MRCEEIMKRDVQTTEERETLQQAAAHMARRNLGFLPVLDAAGAVVGTITDRDIAVRAVAAGLAPDHPVAEIMTREVVACRPGDLLETAERLMAERQKSRLLVLGDDGTLAGVISLSDLAEKEAPRRAASVLRKVAARENAAR